MLRIIFHDLRDHIQRPEMAYLRFFCHYRQIIFDHNRSLAQRYRIPIAIELLFAARLLIQARLSSEHSRVLWYDVLYFATKRSSINLICAYYTLGGTYCYWIFVFGQGKCHFEYYRLLYQILANQLNQSKTEHQFFLFNQAKCFVKIKALHLTLMKI